MSKETHWKLKISGVKSAFNPSELLNSITLSSLTFKLASTCAKSSNRKPQFIIVLICHVIY